MLEHPLLTVNSTGSKQQDHRPQCNAMNASRVVFSSAIFENACSVLTMSCNGVCSCATRQRQHKNQCMLFT